MIVRSLRVFYERVRGVCYFSLFFFVLFLMTDYWNSDKEGNNGVLSIWAWGPKTTTLGKKYLSTPSRQIYVAWNDGTFYFWYWYLCFNQGGRFGSFFTNVILKTVFWVFSRDWEKLKISDFEEYLVVFENFPFFLFQSINRVSIFSGTLKTEKSQELI